MGKLGSKSPKTRIEDSVGWITEDGYLDPKKLPIDAILKQTVLTDRELFRSGCSMLQTMYSHGRLESAIYLLGLLQYYQGDLDRAEIVVEKLSGFKTKECADSLVTELKRVKSSNTTRRYLGSILKVLANFPYEIVKEKLGELAEDTRFSYKMRKKIENTLEEAFLRSRGSIV